MLVVTAAAPVRVCDCGGWTDTWFARYGRVFNIAVRPCAEVRVVVSEAVQGRPRVTIEAADFGDRYTPIRVGGGWDRHPLLEAAIESVPVPERLALEVSITCPVPAGASTGTSAAVTVALLGALDVVSGGRLTRRDIARAAHAVETERLGQQSGIQDQLSSALGGVNDIEMTAYPEARVHRLALPPLLRTELERRLALIFLGRGHSSSEIHGRVIERLASLGPDCPELDCLRRAAGAARDALAAGDLDGLGRAMSENTDAQRRLHPDLVCRDAERVVAVAREHGATGWKVNGAGGHGGSMTLLLPASEGAGLALLREIQDAIPTSRHIPTMLDDDGLRVTSRHG